VCSSDGPYFARSDGTPLAKPSNVERLISAQGPQGVAVVTVVTIVALASALEANLAPEAAERARNIIQRVVANTTPAGVGWRATRELRAGTRSGKHQGWMDVDTAMTPAGFTWTVLVEGGSERTRNKVFRELLQAEAQSVRSGSHDAALTPANYEFLPMDSPGSSQIKIRVKPLRADPRLIDGVLTVSSDGSPLMLEGKLAKSPSFWVKSVTVVNRYDRFAGVVLPVAVESIADLKIVGQSTFSMRYRYSEVNGRRVSHVASAAPMFGPSPELEALASARVRN
jgi:hypothetical protein